jgi:Asp-tRNA(Asn)/Glu-tRNA(Gln) amidotransferase A subunit family amidase
MLNLTLEDIASGLDGGRFTSEELVKAYVARINEVD